VIRRGRPFDVPNSFTVRVKFRIKMLVAYYSRPGNNYVDGKTKFLPVGNTEVAAKLLAAAIGADLFRIDSKTSYSEDYTTCTEEAKADLRNDVRPELTCIPDNLEKYNVLYLGYPVFWGTMPMAVFTFLELFNWKGKVIMPFCTHEGSGLGKSESDIKRICPAAEVKRGLAIRGSDAANSKSSLEKWSKL
jgi:flavodoxin